MPGKAPKAPDPYKVAEAQTQSNIRTAQEQARLAMTGQVGPQGSVQYVADPTSPSGFRAVSTLSPENQALLEQSQDLQAQYGGIAGEQLGRVGDTLEQPFDLSAGRATEISDIHRTLLDPQWNARAEALQTDLLNRGIRPGSEAYEREMSLFNQQRNDAYNQMFLAAYDTANRSALTERGLPLAELNALRTGMTPPPTMGDPRIPTPGVAATDVTGPVYQNYAQQMGAYNAGMGGLFGLGSAALGGWAMRGMPTTWLTGAAAATSDRRLKTNIRKVGDDPRGWGVYVFRYIWDGAKELGWKLGFMADEVEKVRPEVVVEHPSGYKMVNYDALALA